MPPYFAKRLSFPERVTPWNVERLREAVIRGPDELPGAVAVEDERGRLVLLSHLNPQKREAVAKQLLSGSTPGATMGAGSRGRVTAATASAAVGAAGPGKIVYRHLRDGDLMLTNRQPTLHKPGLMAHRARVLKGERTIRMHYANCSTFNADFDGDEINLHLPQVSATGSAGGKVQSSGQRPAQRGITGRHPLPLWHGWSYVVAALGHGCTSCLLMYVLIPFQLVAPLQ